MNFHPFLIKVLNNRLNIEEPTFRLFFTVGVRPCLPAYKLFILFHVYFGFQPFSYSTVITHPAVIHFSVIRKLKLQIGFSNFYWHWLIVAFRRIFEQPAKQICLLDLFPHLIPLSMSREIHYQTNRLEGIFS